MKLIQGLVRLFKFFVGADFVSARLFGWRQGPLLLVLFLVFSGLCQAQTTVPQVCHLNDCATLEVVSKPEDLERGLMYRSSLAPDHGMLFVFTSDDKQQFWMKNMHFSLDILWINSEGRIVYIGENIPACLADPCPVYSPGEAARYVLELNSGYTAAHHWKVGDKLDLKGFFKK